MAIITASTRNRVVVGWMLDGGWWSLEVEVEAGAEVEVEVEVEVVVEGDGC